MDFNAILNWIIINIPFLLAVALLICFAVRAWKEGFVSELFAFISALIASVAILLLALAVHSVFDNERIALVVAIVLLILLGIFHRLINLLFDPIQLVAKLPVVKVLDKILGIAMALFETAVIIWTVYSIIIIVDAGILGDIIVDCVKNNPLMGYLYEHNPLYILVDYVSKQFTSLNIWDRLGR